MIYSSEDEFKVMLSKEQYGMLNSSLQFDHFISQKNYYYASLDKELENNDVTVRIRVFDDKNKKLQIKVKREVENPDFSSKDEYEFEFQDRIPKTIDLEKYNRVGKMGLKAVQLIGVMRTDRKTQRREGLLIVLDKNYYLGCIDYELEVEFERGMITEARELILSLKLEPMNELGKYRRFIQCLLKGREFENGK